MADPFKDLGFEEDKEHSQTPDGFVEDVPVIPVAQEEPSQLMAAERGAEQGLTMGFSDELRGALQAVPEAVSSDKTLESLYQQYRDAERAKLKQLQEAHPWTYGGSELISGAIIPGAGLGGSVAKAVGRGIAAGALTGLGTSEADLTKDQVSQAATDAATGAVLGGAGGAVGGLLGKYGSKAGASSLAQESDLLTKMRQAYKFEKEGTRLTTEAARQSSAKKLLEASGKLKESFEAADEIAGKALGEAYKEASDAGLNLKDPIVKEMTAYKQQLMDLAADITSPERKAQVMGVVKEIDNLLMEPAEVIDGIQGMKAREKISIGNVKQFREAMKGLGVIAKGQGFDTFPELTGKASQISKSSSDILKKSVPGAEELSSKVSAAKSAQDILNTVNDVFERKDLKAHERTAALIAALEKSGIKGESVSKLMETLAEKAEQAGVPELSDYIKSELPKLAQEYELSQAIGKKGFSGFGQTVEGLGVRGAAHLGRAAKALPEALGEFKQGLGIPSIPGAKKGADSISALLNRLKEKAPGNAEQRGVAIGREAAALVQPKMTPAQTSKSLYEADPDTLNSLSDNLSQSDNEKMRGYGNSLKNAIETNNTALKNAVLFQISQDPKARKLINPQK